MTIGPVVGHARVNTNLSMDSSSIGNIGDRIATQLSKMGDRMNDKLVNIGKQNGKVYRDIGRDAVVAWRAALGLFVTSAPWMGAAVSAAAGAVTMMAGSLYSLGQTAFAAYPLLGSMGVALGTLKIGMKGFLKTITETDPKAFKEMLADLAPSAQEAALAFRGLGNVAEELRLSVQQEMFKGLQDSIDTLAITLFPVLTKNLTAMATEWNGLAVQVLNYINSAAGLATINGFLEGSTSIFGKLKDFVVPFLDGAMKLFIALTPAGERLADRITGVAKSFQSWTSAEGFGDRIESMMQRAEKTGGLLLKVVGNLGGALANVFKAANGPTNDFLGMLLDLTRKFKDWSGSVEGSDTIAKWAGDANRVMAQVGKTIEAVFNVVKDLASADALISFLKTLEDAFNYLGKLPLEAVVDKFVELAEVFRPISGPIVAFIIAGAAFNIMLGNMMGQIGGAVAGIAAGRTGFKAFVDVVTKGTGGLSGFSKFTTMFKNFAGVLAKGLKFAGIAGLVVWIGTLIAKSKDLQDKFKGIWAAVKTSFGQITGAFSKVAGALGPTMIALQPFFDILDKIGTLAVGLVLDTIRMAISGIGNVVEGVGSMLAGFITILTGLFTWDPALMLEGWNTFVSGLMPLLNGALQLFLTLFAPAKILKIGSTIIRALGTGLKSGGGAVVSFVVSLVERILIWIGTLPGKFLSFGKKAVSDIAGGIKATAGQAANAAKYVFDVVINWIKQLPGKLFNFAKESIGRMAGIIRTDAGLVATAAKGVFDAVVNWIKQLPAKLLGFGKTAVGDMAGGMRATLGQVTSAAKLAFDGVVNAIKALPAKLAEFGRTALSNMAGAVRNGVGAVRSAASSIVGAVTGAVSGLPGQMVAAGRRIVGGIADGIRAGIQRVKSAASAVAQAVKNFLPGSPVKEGPLRAWNTGSDASGGGRNVVEGIVSGLQNTSPIRSAMNDVANAVRDSLTPQVNVGRRVGGLATVGAGTVDSGRTTIHIENLTMPVEVADLESVPRIANVLEELSMKVRQGVRPVR